MARVPAAEGGVVVRTVLCRQDRGGSDNGHPAAGKPPRLRHLDSPSNTSPLLRLRMRRRVMKKAPVEAPTQMKVFRLCRRSRARSLERLSSERLKVARWTGAAP